MSFFKRLKEKLVGSSEEEKVQKVEQDEAEAKIEEPTQVEEVPAEEPDVETDPTLEELEEPTNIEFEEEPDVELDPAVEEEETSEEETETQEKKPSA